MAYFTRTKKGWRAQIERKGIRESQTFVTKKAAELWAADRERAIIDGQVSKWPRKTLRDALDRYAEEITPTKRSARAEALRLAAFARHFPDLAGKIISEVTPADIAGWRDAYLRRVTPGSVKRVGNSLRAVFTVAHREWGWCPESPFRMVTMPSDNPARDRLAGWREIRRILRRCDYVTHHPPVSVLQGVAWAFLVALRTGMRAAEVLRLEVGDVGAGVATIRQHKSAHLTGKPRMVPMTPQGTRLTGELVAFAQARGRARLLEVSSASLEALFRKVTKSLMIEDLHFHDSRGTGLTHLAKKLDLVELARVSGHRDVRILAHTYYRATAQQIADKLKRRP
jgi:integrase